MRNLDAILTVEGIDVFFVAFADLAQTMGVSEGVCVCVCVCERESVCVGVGGCRRVCVRARARERLCVPRMTKQSTSRR